MNAIRVKQERCFRIVLCQSHRAVHPQKTRKAPSPSGNCAPKTCRGFSNSPTCHKGRSGSDFRNAVRCTSLSPRLTEQRLDEAVCCTIPRVIPPMPTRSRARFRPSGGHTESVRHSLRITKALHAREACTSSQHMRRMTIRDRLPGGSKWAIAAFAKRRFDGKRPTEPTKFAAGDSSVRSRLLLRTEFEGGSRKEWRIGVDGSGHCAES